MRLCRGRYAWKHTPTAGKIAVVVSYSNSQNSDTAFPLSDSVFAHIDGISTPGFYTETGPLDFTGLMRHFNKHGVYSYKGSLTTPPCMENVPWYISTEPIPLNVQTYSAVKNVVKDQCSVHPEHPRRGQLA